MASLDPGYLSGPKVRWFANWSTIVGLWRLRDRQGRPVFRPEFNEAGEPVLLGFACAVCPGLDSVGPAKVPVLFGNGDYFAVRIVKNAIAIAQFREKYAEYGLNAYKALLRCNGALVCADAASTPIKALMNAS